MSFRGRSQNAEINIHNKGRLLYRAMIIINCVPLKNVDFSESKEFAGANYFLK